MPPDVLSHLAGRGRGQLKFRNLKHLLPDGWAVWDRTPDWNSVVASLPEILTCLVPLPGLICFQQGIEGMHICGQIGDKLFVVVDHPQEGTELTHIAWCWGSLDGVKFGWCYMNGLSINVLPKVVD